MPPKDEGFCSQHDRLIDNDNRIMDRILTIGETLAEVNTKVALLLEDHGNRIKTIDKRLEKIDTRLTRLSYAVIILAVAAVGSPAYGPVLQRLLGALVGGQ